MLTQERENTLDISLLRQDINDSIEFTSLWQVTTPLRAYGFHSPNPWNYYSHSSYSSWVRDSSRSPVPTYLSQSLFKVTKSISVKTCLQPHTVLVLPYLLP